MKISRFFYCAVCAFFIFTNFSAFAQNKQFTPQQVSQIQQIVHSYLVSNPQVLVEASMALQKKQVAAARKQTDTAIAMHKDKLFNFKEMPYAGNPKGKIVMMEFFDYRCPHCQLMTSVVGQLIKNNPDLKLVLAEWPIFRGTSVDAAQAALAAMNQGKYYVFHNKLLAKAEQLAMGQKPLTKKDIFDVAKGVGLNLTKLKADMKSAKVQKMLAANDKMARSIRVVGTPAFIIVNTKTQKFQYFDGQTTADKLQKVISAVK